MAASKVACASFNIGSSTVITITRDKSSYTHTITYKFGNATGTIATKTSNTSIAWNPDKATLYAQMTNLTRRSGTVTCQTYDGNTLIGTTTATFYASAVKEDCIPTVTATIVDTNATTIALTGSSAKLIRYMSKPKVTMTATPKYSATIVSRQIYNPVGLTATTSPYTFDTVYSDEFRVRATDSRGYSKETTYNVGFVEYDPAFFNSVYLKRTESTSTTATLTLKGYCFKGSFGAVSNTLTVKYRYKTGEGSYSSYVTLAAPTWNTDGSFSLTTNMTSLSLDEKYTFEFVVEDKLTSFISDEIVLSKGTGDLRIGKDYILSKNNFVTGDINNTEWKCFKARRKRDGVNYDANFGAGFGGGGITAVMELNEIVNGVENKVARYDLMKDGHLYNYFSNMSVAEMMSFAPSIVAGGSQGYFLLNSSSAPILVQWGRVSITPTAANTTTTLNIKFNYQYQGIPIVKTEPSTGAPSSVDVNAGDITADGFTIYLQRATATATSIMWFAVGNGANALPE